MYIWGPFAETVGSVRGMEECIRNYRCSGALASIFVSWAICWGGVTVAWRPDTTIRCVVATCTSYARRAESMSGGQVVRHSPLHSNKKGTLINHYTVSKILKPYTNGINILNVRDQPCVYRHGPENER